MPKLSIYLYLYEVNLAIQVTFRVCFGFINSMKYFLSLFLWVVLISSSCKKETPTGELIKGKNKIIVTVMHHERILQGIPVYVKFNATEFPGHDTTMYDWNKTSDLSGVAFFEDMFDGNYFIYGKGIDTGIGVEVMGAAALAVYDSTTVNNEIYVTLMVTE